MIGSLHDIPVAIKLYKWLGNFHVVGKEVLILRHPDISLVDCKIKSHEVMSEEPLVISMIFIWQVCSSSACKPAASFVVGRIPVLREMLLVEEIMGLWCDMVKVGDVNLTTLDGWQGVI